jgi:hypothetical protein
MSDLFSGANPDVVIPLVTLTLVAICALALVIGVCWYKIHKYSTAAKLKQEMLDRGMSAEDIKTVLEARLNH